jgi:hypothetical protein
MRDAGFIGAVFCGKLIYSDTNFVIKDEVKHRKDG